MRALPLLALVLAACGGGSSATPDAAPLAPTANPGREVVATQLHVDLDGMTATATITLGPSTSPGASLEVGDLGIEGVTANGADVPFAVTASELDLGLPADDQPITIDVAYHWRYHDDLTGASIYGYTMLWPYFCGNLFPCHSDPADGTTFALDLTGVPSGQTAVYPEAIPADAPAYQIAWAIGEYTELPLGTTTAGTQISTWYRPTGEAAARAGTQHLVAAFDWFEQTLGAYRFGPTYASIAVAWPGSAYGGMEHHPISHIAIDAMSSEETQVHEAAHGWFGDGIRIQCWEDFVLSEGTVSYLAARALDVVAPDVGAATWSAYESELQALSDTDPVWPQSCGQVDVLQGGLYTNAPYMRGAFFYKAVADKVGADVLDHALAAFYQAHQGGSATMADMLDTIHAVTGYDPTACAKTWLEDPTVPTPGPCP